MPQNSKHRSAPATEPPAFVRNLLVQLSPNVNVLPLAGPAVLDAPQNRKPKNCSICHIPLRPSDKDELWMIGAREGLNLTSRLHLCVVNNDLYLGRVDRPCTCGLEWAVEESAKKGAQIYEKNAQIYEKNAQIYEKNAEIYEKNPEIYGKNPEIYEKNPEIYEKNPEIYRKNPEIYEKNPEIYEKNPEIYQKDPQMYEIDMYEKTCAKGDILCDVDKRGELFFPLCANCDKMRRTLTTRLVSTSSSDGFDRTLTYRSNSDAFDMDAFDPTFFDGCALKQGADYNGETMKKYKTLTDITHLENGHTLSYIPPPNKTQYTADNSTLFKGTNNNSVLTSENYVPNNKFKNSHNPNDNGYLAGCRKYLQFESFFPNFRRKTEISDTIKNISPNIRNISQNGTQNGVSKIPPKIRPENTLPSKCAAPPKCAPKFAKLSNLGAPQNNAGLKISPKMWENGRQQDSNPQPPVVAQLQNRFDNFYIQKRAKNRPTDYNTQVPNYANHHVGNDASEANMHTDMSFNRVKNTTIDKNLNLDEVSLSAQKNTFQVERPNKNNISNISPKNSFNISNNSRNNSQPCIQCIANLHRNKNNNKNSNKYDQNSNKYDQNNNKYDQNCNKYDQHLDPLTFFETTFYLKLGRDYIEVPKLRVDGDLGGDLLSGLRLKGYGRVGVNAVIKMGPSPLTMEQNRTYASRFSPSEYPSFVFKQVAVNGCSEQRLNSANVHKDYDIFYDILLGKGGNGEVYLGLNRESGEAAALKKEPENMLAAEFRFLKFSTHLHTVAPIAYYPHQRKNDFLVLEFLSGGTIRQLLKTRYTKGLPIEVVREFFGQVMSALSKMHLIGLVHRDLKTANLMLTEPYPHGYVKIVDFGNGHQKTHRNALIGTNMTTCFACAPEILQWVYKHSEGYTEKVDIWAAGTILYELLTGKRLFDRNQLDDVKPLVENFKISSIPSLLPRDTSPLALELLQLLLHKHPATRISAADALSHPFFHHSL